MTFSTGPTTDETEERKAEESAKSKVEGTAVSRSLVLKAPTQQSDSKEWLALFADLMTTVMIFFILLYSMSNLDSGKYREMKNSIKDYLVKGRSEKEVLNQAIKDFDELEQTLSAYIKKEQLSSFVVITKDKNQLGITVNAPIFFKIGEAELLKSAYTLMDIIVKALKNMEFNILVEGHTDDLPINTSRFRNNWDLSTSRASAVVSYMIQKGINPMRLTAAGYAEFYPLVANTSKANRAKNRRVEIKILR